MMTFLQFRPPSLNHRLFRSTHRIALNPHIRSLSVSFFSKVNKQTVSAFKFVKDLILPKPKIDPASTFEFELQKIPPIAGSLWISNAFEFGNFMSIVKIWYKLRGREKEFQNKIYNEIDKAFDRIQFPNIRQIIPDFKEKGCYITFATKEQAKQSLSLLTKGVVINNRTCPVFLVQGVPFIEDLKIKSSIFLKVALTTNSDHVRLTTEMLFNEFRQFGKIDAIVIDEKATSATVRFAHITSAIAAKNCIHWKPIGDTQFSVRYIPYSRILKMLEFLSNPKIMIPLFSLLATLSLFLLLDPIRLASVTQQVTRGVQDELSKSGTATEEDEPSMRVELVDKMDKTFRLPPTDKIFIITGPPGCGKTFVFRKVLHNRTFAVRMDCSMDTVQDFAEALGRAIGFSPSFSAILTIVGWFESVVPGLKKSALSPSTQTQLESILRTLGNAVFLISAGLPRVQGMSFPVIAFDGFPEMIDRLSRTDENSAKMLLDILMKWTAHTSRYAHIVFIGQNPFGEDIIRTHPEIRKRKVLSMKIPDLTQDEALIYLKYHLGTRYSNEELTSAVEIFGGRIFELQMLVSRVNTGIPLGKAVDDMIRLAEGTIRAGFGGQIFGTSQKKWTQTQLWKSIKLISKDGSVSYDKLLFYAFNGSVEALKSLVSSKLLLVELDSDGKLVAKAYSPVYQRAFYNLVNKSPGLARGLDRLEHKEEIGKLMDELKRYEDELEVLKAGENGEHKEALKERRAVIADKILYLNKKLAKREEELRVIEERPLE